MICRQQDPPRFRSGFLVFEGIFGSGKSSTLAAVVATLSQETGLSIQTTREAGGTPFGTKVRELLLGGERLSAEVELFLFSADRAAHVQEVIQPAIASRTPLISDRFFYSTVVNQSFALGLSRPFVEQVCRVATNGIRPDAVLLFDVTTETGMRRSQKRPGKGHPFERAPEEYSRRVREAYLTIAAEYPEPFYVIDTEKPHAEVIAEAVALVRGWLSTRENHAS